jgi:hypothetical protein
MEVGAMRVEATITDVQGAQLEDLVEELKTSKSQIIEEALALFLKVFMETKRGRRVAIIEPESQKTVAEVVSPTLTHLEWTAHRQRIVLDDEEMEKVVAAVKNPRPPTEALKRLMAKRRR